MVFMIRPLKSWLFYFRPLHIHLSCTVPAPDVVGRGYYDEFNTGKLDYCTIKARKGQKSHKSFEMN